MGGLVVLVQATMDRIAPSLVPIWDSFSAAAHYSPMIGTALGPVAGYVSSTAFFLLVLAAIDIWTDRWTRRKGIALGIFVLLGFVYSGTLINGLIIWLVAGPQTGILIFFAYVLVRRLHISLVPWAVAFMSISDLVQKCVANPYPGALAGSILAVILLAGLAMLWEKKLST